jgi:hypothetical protein
MLEDNMYQLNHSSTSCHPDIAIGCIKAVIIFIKTGNHNFQNEKGKEHKSWNVYALWRKYISCTFVMQTSYFNIVNNLNKSNMRLFRSVDARDENSEKYFIMSMLKYFNLNGKLRYPQVITNMHAHGKSTRRA